MNIEHDRPRAAVVIIAYNDETHIERAIQSVCNQTERNIEIICVDDGSTDATCELMRLCAQRDARIRVITQPNSGALGARYAGLRQVTGDYVLFLDSDDVYMPEAVETACAAADETGADVLEFGVSLIKDENNPPTQETWAYLERYFSQKQPLPETDHGPELVNACFAGQAITWNIWNKLYRTELLQKAFRFYQGEWICMEEDMLLSLMVLCQARRYARIPAKLYAYTVGGGISTTAEKVTDTEVIKKVATGGLTLKLAWEWLNKLGCAQDEAMSGMDALTTAIRGNMVDQMLNRVAAEKRGEYLKLLSQHFESNDCFDLISEAISQQQGHIEHLEGNMRRLEEQNRELQEQNRRLQESFDTISNAFFWKISEPLRLILDKAKYRFKDNKLAHSIWYTLKWIRWGGNIPGSPVRPPVEKRSFYCPGEPMTILCTKQTWFIGQLIQTSLNRAGIVADILTDEPKEYRENVYIVVCPYIFQRLPHRYISFQMEQTISSRWLNKQYLMRLEDSFAVFDYSLVNIEYFKRTTDFSRKFYYLPVDYLPGIRREADGYEYDVVFYGDIDNDRRQAALKKLSQRFRVKILAGVFGEELYTELCRAKIVVNIHYYENALLETTRLYETLSLGRSIIVSERSTDTREEERLEELVDFVPANEFDSMADRISYWLTHEEERKAVVERNNDLLAHRPSAFNYYFLRFLLANNWLSVNDFYRLAGDFVHFDTNHNSSNKALIKAGGMKLDKMVKRFEAKKKNGKR